MLARFMMFVAVGAAITLLWWTVHPRDASQPIVDAPVAPEPDHRARDEQLEEIPAAPKRLTPEGSSPRGERADDVAGTEEADIEVVLRGRVLDRADGRPLRDVPILAFAEVVTRSGADGRFVIPSDILDRFQVLRVLPARSAPKLLRIPEPLPPGELVVWIERAASLRGTVLAADGQPAVGYIVQATTPSHYLLDPLQRPMSWAGSGHAAPRWCAATDATGGFALELITGDTPLAFRVHRPPQPGERVRVDSLGRFDRLPERVEQSVVWKSPRLIRLDPGETREVLVQLPQPGLVAGSVVDELGTPVPGVEVWLVPRSDRMPNLRDIGMIGVPEQRASTAGDGSFGFDAVRPGAWLVGVAPLDEPTDDALATCAEAVDVPSIQARNVRIEAQRGSTLAGRLVDQDGEGIVWVSLRADEVTGTSWRSVKTTAEGGFRLPQLSPGEYDFELVAPRELELLGPTRGRPGGAELLLVAGPRLVSCLRGRVVDPAADGPFEGELRIRPTPRPAPAGHTSTVLTNAPDFKLDGLRPGAYDIFFHADRDLCALLENVRLAPGEVREGVEVSLQPAGRMNLSYRGRHPRVTATVRRGDAFVTRFPIEPALPGVVVLPTGILSLTLTAGAETVWQGSVTIRAGEVTEVRVP